MSRIIITASASMAPCRGRPLNAGRVAVAVVGFVSRRHVFGFGRAKYLLLSVEIVVGLW